MKHGLQSALFPPPARTARFHRLPLEHLRHLLAARIPLRMTWRTTWPLCSVKRSASICQADQVVEARQVEVVEARQAVEDQVAEVHQMEE